MEPKNYIFYRNGINFFYFYINILFCLCINGAVLASNVLRPRGVSLSMTSFYDPSKSFTCFDGAVSIPFTYVNDDYCDCRDGSDEPGTAACENGSFHCNNIGHVGKDIMSSFVNDGVCDCCDTSDEYASNADCTDNCHILGEAARREARRKAEVQMEGFNLRKKMSDDGLRIKNEKQSRIEELNIEKKKAEADRTEKLNVKQAAEGPESAALEQYKALEEEIKARKEKEQKERDMSDAKEAFNHLDADGDEILTIHELQSKEIFDTNKDGEVSEDEAKFYLQQKDSLDLETFLSSGWALMKPTYVHHKRLFTPPTSEEPPIEDDLHSVEAGNTEPQDGEDYDLEVEPQVEELEEEEEGENEEEFADDLDDLDADKDEEEYDKEDDNEDKIVYDPETQNLIDIANAAREEFKASDDRLRDISKEIQNLQEGLSKDFGPNEEFRVFEDQCFEFTDREYTYKLCPFSSAVQKPKSGHGETQLGSWGSWAGPAGNPYSIMKYTGGQNCWNGPQRSAEVRLFCGLENELTSVTEPNRCEYLFLFSTPAVCAEPQENDAPHQHSEL